MKFPHISAVLKIVWYYKSCENPDMPIPIDNLSRVDLTTRPAPSSGGTKLFIVTIQRDLANPLVLVLGGLSSRHSWTSRSDGVSA